MQLWRSCGTLSTAILEPELPEVPNIEDWHCHQRPVERCKEVALLTNIVVDSELPVAAVRSLRYLP